MRDLLRQLCALVEGDDAVVHTAAVQQRLHECGITAEDDIALLLQLLDLPVAPERLAWFSPEARQSRTFALLRHVVLYATQQQPSPCWARLKPWPGPTTTGLDWAGC